MNLEAIQVQRAEEQLQAFKFHERPPKDKRGGVPLTDKVCKLAGCDNRLAVTNKSGVCAKCSDRHWRRLGRKDPRMKLAKRKDYFSHGGGI